MTPRSLIRWASLEEQRRRSSESGVSAVPNVVVATVLGILLAAEMVRRLSGDASSVLGALHLWTAAAVVGASLTMFAAPFRLYWRRDSKILASLPIPGASLFSLAVWRSQRAGFLVGLFLGIGVVAVGLWGSWEVALRMTVPVAIAVCGTAFLGPAAALAAGAIIASDKARAMISSMGGEFEAPRTSWLGLLPGLAATATAIAIISCAPWLRSARPPGGSITVIAVLGTLLPIALLVLSFVRSAEVIPVAVREVAALDQEILAHVELSTPSALERAWFASTCGSTARLVARKDAALARRRYPSPFFLVPCGIAAVWIVAVAQPSSYLEWGGVFYAGCMMYAVVMASRGQQSPIELPSLLQSLPIAKTEAARGKRSVFSVRVLLIGVLAGPALVLRAPHQGSALVFVLAVTVLCALVCTLLTRPT